MKIHVALLASMIIVGLSTLIPPGTPVAAETLEEEMRRTINEIKKKAATNNRRDQGMAQKGARQTVNDIVKSVPTPAAPEGSGRLKIIDHFRANEGIPFPQTSQVVLEPRPPVVIKLSHLGKGYESKPYRPSKCSSAATTKIPRGEKNKETEEVWVDVLYLPEDMVPMDATEVYGTKVRLRPYGPNAAEGVYYRMENDQVPCLPYRIRITSKGEYYDRGESAYRNYDKDQANKGDIHPWVQAKLRGR